MADYLIHYNRNHDKYGRFARGDGDGIRDSLRDKYGKTKTETEGYSRGANQSRRLNPKSTDTNSTIDNLRKYGNLYVNKPKPTITVRYNNTRDNLRKKYEDYKHSNNAKKTYTKVEDRTPRTYSKEYKYADNFNKNISSGKNYVKNLVNRGIEYLIEKIREKKKKKKRARKTTLTYMEPKRNGKRTETYMAPKTEWSRHAPVKGNKKSNTAVKSGTRSRDETGERNSGYKVVTSKDVYSGGSGGRISTGKTYNNSTKKSSDNKSKGATLANIARKAYKYRKSRG